MKRVLFFTLAATILVGGTVHAAPADPVYPGDPSRVLWFLVVSDQHITARDSDGPENLQWLLGDALTYVQPDIVFNTGDLSDGSNGEPLVSLYPGKQDEEWQLYRQIIDQSGVTIDKYIDLPGNHDQYSDKGNSKYLEYSLAGSTFGRTQHSVVIEKPWGNYHFLGINTTGKDGAGWPLDNAGLDIDELLYILRALEDNADANLTMMFGHHPIVRPDLGFKLNEGSDEVQEFMGDNVVRAYFYGHTHEYRDLYWPENELMPVTLHENVDSFGKADENNILLVAIDNDNLHIRQVTVGQFPWVIVTTPAQIDQGGGNPWAFEVPTGMPQAPIRALGFTSDPTLSCQFSVDGGTWTTMNSIGPHQFQGFMDTRGMTPGAHTVEVRALPGPATGHKVKFSVVSYTCGNGIDDDQDGLTDYPEDPGCESVTDADEYNDPIVPEPSPDVIEDTVVIDDSIDWETADTVVPDQVDTDISVDDPGQPGSDLTEGDPGSADNGSGSDATAASDRSGDDQAGVSDLAVDEVAGEDLGGKPESSGGGCSAGSGASGLAVLFPGLLCLALIAWRRRELN